MKRSWIKRNPKPKGKKIVKEGLLPKTKKLPSIKKLRKDADDLCTPVALKLDSRCLLCGGIAQVGHHAVKKSESSNLRYYVPNIISLCTNCHCKLHARETVWCPMIVSIKGMDWWNDIKSKIWVTVSTNREFYLEAIDRLSSLLK